MPKRYIALGGFFVLLMIGVFLVAATWTADRAVQAPERPDTPQTPGVPPMQR